MSKDIKKEIIERLVKVKKRDRKVVREIKRDIARKYGTDFPKNTELLSTYRAMVKRGKLEKSEMIEWLLVTRPVRSLSGIVNLTVLTKPWSCPGQCIFCPKEEGFPKSYLAGEPAADRAKNLKFNPYLQVTTRLTALKAQGHPTDKIELRIVGGSWNAYRKNYRKWFVKECFRAANNFNSSKGRKQKKDVSLKEAQTRNEKAPSRIVGLSVETRPDFITEENIREMRQLGATLVEMGVQTIWDDIHEKCKTGLTVCKITRATKLLKDSGLKVLYQIMPNLPGSQIEKDIEMFRVLFNDPRFKPDWIKIYPCLVCADTGVHDLWEKGKFTPYTKKELTELLVKVKKELPPWVRVARIFRDVPAEKIIAGCRTSNIREIAARALAQKNKSCSCVRCREVKENWNPEEKTILTKREYRASDGKEVFLSFENEEKTKLYSLLRLRRPQKPFFQALKNTGLIRELQTFGPEIPLGEEKKGAQHKGLGSRLIKEAERITKEEWGLSKIAVISGVGAREYYRKKHHYKLEGTYMVKNL